MIRKLREEEIVKIGDLVTVNDTEESGFRPLQGITGICAGFYSYPIYREVPDYIQAGTFVHCSFSDDGTVPGGCVDIDVNDNDPYSYHCPEQTIYGDEIRALGEWLIAIADAAEARK